MTSPAMNANLSELLEKVKAATGRDIALEREIMCSIGGWQRLSPSQHPRNHKHPMFVDTLEGYGTFEGQTLYRDVPRIMESIDAALALVERCLPGWQMEQIAWGKDKGGTIVASIGNFGEAEAYRYGHGEAATASLAILSALLQAIGEQP